MTNRTHSRLLITLSVFAAHLGALSLEINTHWQATIGLDPNVTSSGATLSSEVASSITPWLFWTSN